jgi:hypothetical protein
MCEELTGAVTIARIYIDRYTFSDVVILYDNGAVVWV